MAAIIIHVITSLSIIALAVPSNGLVRDFLTVPQLKNDYAVIDYRDIPLAFSNFSYRGLAYTGRNYTAYVAVLPSGTRTNFSYVLPSGSTCVSGVAGY